MKCKCDPEIKTGQTSVMCCNICGLPDEEFWQPIQSEEIKPSVTKDKEIAELKAGQEYDLLKKANAEIAELEYEESIQIQVTEQLQKEIEYWKQLAEAAEILYMWQLKSPDSEQLHKSFDTWQRLKRQKPHD